VSISRTVQLTVAIVVWASVVVLAVEVAVVVAAGHRYNGVVKVLEVRDGRRSRYINKSNKARYLPFYKRPRAKSYLANFT
jgi:hypothetical protein